MEFKSPYVQEPIRSAFFLYRRASGAPKQKEENEKRRTKTWNEIVRMQKDYVKVTESHSWLIYDSFDIYSDTVYRWFTKGY